MRFSDFIIINYCKAEYGIRIQQKRIELRLIILLFKVKIKF